jgi:phosphohistidine phosphatase
MFATSAIAGVSFDATTERGVFDWQVGPAQVMAKA